MANPILAAATALLRIVDQLLQSLLDLLHGSFNPVPKSLVLESYVNHGSSFIPHEQPQDGRWGQRDPGGTNKEGEHVGGREPDPPTD